MTREEYKNFLKDLELDIFDRHPIIGLTNAKSVVSKADMEKHSYSEYEVEQYAYELADFVENCIKEYIAAKGYESKHLLDKACQLINSVREKL